MQGMTQNQRMSPLTEGRGLKCSRRVCWRGFVVSPLTEGRGLKFRVTDVQDHLLHVAPHRGAWIEIIPQCTAGRTVARRPSQRGVD